MRLGEPSQDQAGRLPAGCRSEKLQLVDCAPNNVNDDLDFFAVDAIHCNTVNRFARSGLSCSMSV
jgi:hypothetical protein